MVAYWFRFVNAENKPTGYIGLAVGKNIEDILWQIDEFGDPWSVQIQSVRWGGMCWKENKSTDPDEDNYSDEYEVTEYSPDPWADKGWKTPKWVGTEEAQNEYLEKMYKDCVVKASEIK